MFGMINLFLNFIVRIGTLLCAHDDVRKNGNHNKNQQTTRKYKNKNFPLNLVKIKKKKITTRACKSIKRIPNPEEIKNDERNVKKCSGDEASSGSSPVKSLISASFV
jgi:hypothetical protein